MIKTALFGTPRCQNGTEWHLFSITGSSCIFFQSSTETVQGPHPLSNDHPLKTGGSAISTTDLRLRIFPVPCCNLPFGLRKCKSILEKFRIILFSAGRWGLVPGQETQNDGFFDSKMDK